MIFLLKMIEKFGQENFHFLSSHFNGDKYEGNPIKLTSMLYNFQILMKNLKYVAKALQYHIPMFIAQENFR